MPARNPLITFIRRIQKLETPIANFNDNYLGSFTNFELLPAAAVAAGSDKLLLLSGTGTEVVARAPKGGVRLTTQATIPADNDQVQVAGVADTNMGKATTAANGFNLIGTAELRLAFGMALPAITSLFASGGYDENITDVDPGGTAGDGAKFLFVPSADKGDLTVDPGLTTAQYSNWICHYKVAGADVFAATTVPVVAGTDYQFEIVIGTDRKPRFYINNSLVYTGTNAMTSGSQLGTLFGVEVGASAAAQKSVDIRYVKVQRTIA